MRSIRNIILGTTLALAALSAGGCGTYTLQGKVIQGNVSSIEIVHKMDERLHAKGVANAEVLVRRDPKGLNMHLAGKDRSSATGDFAIRINEFGAGWMEEQWLVQSAAAGHRNTESLTKLPPQGNKWMLLITLAPGQTSPLELTDGWQEDLSRFR